jgi:hypothetical protein
VTSGTEKPSFLITIDTEGDNLWSRPQVVHTNNSRYLPRFQALCEKYKFKPTYLTNWEMANCPVFQEFGRDVLARGTGEIGMHLHAWDSPPLSPLTEDDARYHPFLIDFPAPIIREKVRVLTEKLEETFAVDMVSHRAGRWGFNEVYARVLLDQGYRVDCSVTPGINWLSRRDHPQTSRGSDYSQFPDHAYFVDLDDISRSGASCLLEVPVTIFAWSHGRIVEAIRPVLCRSRLGRSTMVRVAPTHCWLRPKRRNLKEMQSVLELARAAGREYVEFMLHSSEFMPGGSKTFPDERSIDLLYENMEKIFDDAARTYRGQTLAEFVQDKMAAGRPNGSMNPTASPPS